MSDRANLEEIRGRLSESADAMVRHARGTFGAMEAERLDLLAQRDQITASFREEWEAKGLTNADLPGFAECLVVIVGGLSHGYPLEQMIPHCADVVGRLLEIDP